MNSYLSAGLAICMMASTACATTITEKELTITYKDDHCVVQFSGESIPTKLSPPCTFVKDRHGDIRSHTYHSARMTVFMIMGKPSETGSDCSNKSQWFVLGDTLMVPDYIRDDLVCVNRGGDEIAYRDVFHYIPNGQELLNSMPAGEYD